jgi:diaminopimelate epimerase
VIDLEFTKTQGLGNDFLIIEVDDIRTLRAAPQIARELCNRNFGAGADGVIFLTGARNAEADFASRIFNSDGSEAQVSGNGTRCVAAYLYHSGLWSEPEVRIDTAAGVKSGRLVSRESSLFRFEFDMGCPQFGSDAVPIAIDPPVNPVLAYPIHLGGEVFEVTCLSMGNPQTVIFVEDLEAVTLSDLGPLIEQHPIFPDRTNVEFAHVIDRRAIEILIWERGAGHTLSSGTGSCASAVAAAMNGLTERRVAVRTEGGVLEVDWREDDRVALTGPAEVIYKGRWVRALG